MKLKHILYGMIIGVANIIPGVSGGTMAVILNVYDEIIEGVSNITKDIKKSITFLLPIGIGAGIGIILFSKIIEYCLATIPSITNMAFVGLIIGSIPMIGKKMANRRMKPSIVISFLLTLGIMIAMMIMKPDDSGVTLITSLTVSNFLILFGASAVAAAAMIIPGISGSFIMLILGTYTSVLTAISSFNIPVLIPVALGCAVGILLCAKIIEKLFKSFPTQTYAGILGFMIGSVFIILPPMSWNTDMMIGVLVGIGAAVGAYSFSKK